MGGERRPQSQQALPHGAAPLTQPASEVAASSVGPELDLCRTVDLSTVSQVPLSLDPALARLLPLALVLHLLALCELARKELMAQVNTLAQGALPAPVLGLILPLIRGALVDCPALPVERRAYVAGLLPAVPVPFGAGEVGRIAGLVATADGYDLALRSTDGAVRVVPITMPAHLVEGVFAAVLTLGASIVQTPSAAAVRSLVGELVAGRAQPVADAVAVALVAAICASDLVDQPVKDAIYGLNAVSDLLERTAA